MIHYFDNRGFIDPKPKSKVGTLIKHPKQTDYQNKNLIKSNRVLKMPYTII